MYSANAYLQDSEKRRCLYLVIEAREPRLCRIVPAIPAVGAEELLTLSSQCVDAGIQVNVQSAGVIDGQFRLHGQEPLCGVHWSRFVCV
jgi:hypothetical protein